MSSQQGGASVTQVTEGFGNGLTVAANAQDEARRGNAAEGWHAVWRWRDRNGQMEEQRQLHAKADVPFGGRREQRGDEGLCGNYAKRHCRGKGAHERRAAFEPARQRGMSSSSESQRCAARSGSRNELFTLKVLPQVAQGKLATEEFLHMEQMASTRGAGPKHGYEQADIGS